MVRTVQGMRIHAAPNPTAESVTAPSWGDNVPSDQCRPVVMAFVLLPSEQSVRPSDTLLAPDEFLCPTGRRVFVGDAATARPRRQATRGRRAGSGPPGVQGRGRGRLAQSDSGRSGGRERSTCGATKGDPGRRDLVLWPHRAATSPPCVVIALGRPRSDTADMTRTYDVGDAVRRQCDAVLLGLRLAHRPDGHSQLPSLALRSSSVAMRARPVSVPRVLHLLA